MSRKPARSRATPSVPPIEPGPRLSVLGRAGWIVVAAIFAGLVAFGGWRLFRSGPPPERPAPTFVGGANCASCHAKEAAAWKGSHHDLAMEPATAESVLGDFDNARFTQARVTSTFFRREQRYFVNTDGSDGKLADFEIRYTFGVQPLQQYLVAFPDGRLQALGVAWDARPKAEGGQRWFHLYPDDPPRAGDRLHWTGIDQNWNYQCAGCHSTDLRKNYDAQADRFRTTWTDIDVNCESCHGPGSRHVAWARNAVGGARDAQPDKGLVVALDERHGIAWRIDPATGNGVRSAVRASRREIEVCATCHARRGQFTDRDVHGRPLGDSHQVATLQSGLYFPDGQMRDEVYNHGSFLQSRMNAKGVTCSDCHEPHSQKLVASGNAVCAQCHLATKYDGEQHHHHPSGTTGAACVACHMPVRPYMVIDPRHDHSLRIPRPDRAVAMGVPDPCTDCHRDRKPTWAAAAIQGWVGHAPGGFQRFAEAFAADDRRDASAAAQLRSVAADRTESTVARASAVERLAHWPEAGTTDTLKTALADEDPLVRAAAARALGTSGLPDGVAALAYRLRDPVREVRMAVARTLAGAPERTLIESDRGAFEAALEELVEALRFDADRPEARTNLGSLFAARGQHQAALAELRRALEIDPGYVPGTVNLADVLRESGDDAGAVGVLREGLRRAPGVASLHHALGLALVRQVKHAEALVELRRAVDLEPADTRFRYVYAVALHDRGRSAEAVRMLEDAARRAPRDRAVLGALAQYEHARGHEARAEHWNTKLRGLDPAQ